MRVVIIPSILAFTFLGLSTYLNSLFTSIFQYIAWITALSSQFYAQDQILESVWGDDLVLASLAITMTVNL